MNNDDSNIGIFVPARLSSQRLPHKQILPIGDSNMFEICCKKLSYISENYGISTYVLICDKELIDIAMKYPSVEIIIRDKETAEAEGPLRFIYKDILELPHKYLMFLNPCLIFLQPSTIVNQIMKFLISEKNYGTSVKKFQNWLWVKGDAKEIVIPLTDINYERLTTKEISNYYQAAHCFHIFNKELFKNDGYMLKNDLCLLEVPEEEVIDIDTREEYEYAKWKWEKVNI